MNIVEQRLDELIGYRGADEFQALLATTGRGREALDKLESFLQEKGFTPLGKGAFGVVYQHPGLDYVVKIFRNDPSYLTFAKYVQANQSNPHLPRFRGKFIKVGEQNCVVRMERLQPLSYPLQNLLFDVIDKVRSEGTQNWIKRAQNYVEPTAEQLEQFEAKRDEYFEAAEEWDKVRHRGIADPEQYERVRQKLVNARKELSALSGTIDNNARLYRFTLDYPLLLTTLEAVTNLEGDYYVDLHGGNFMMRGEVPVITDPLASKD